MKYLMFCFFTICFFTLNAQEDKEIPAFVAGPVYKVINAADGPVILWEGKAADPAQIVQSAPDLIKVYPPNSIDARLLIYLKPDGRLKEIIDLEYQSNPSYRSEENKETVEAFNPAEPIRHSFTNGLVFTYENGTASAFYEGEFLKISGSKGRFRIKTETFEAGIAFGPEYGTTVYTYLKEK